MGVHLPLSFSLVLASTVGLVVGCNSSLETFRCQTNADCSSEGQSGGVCERAEVCSFEDPACTGSGQRYGPASGEQSNRCVGERTASPDASEIGPQPDASLSVADADPSVPDAAVIFPPDAAPTDGEPGCPALLSLAVYDDKDANDYGRVRVNGINVLECQPSPSLTDQDTMVSCEFCMPLGAGIEVSGKSAAHVELFLTDCNSDCASTVDKCNFVATESCAATIYLDISDPLPI